MRRESLDDLRTLVAVARERSFTKTAAKLGISQSALSQTIRELESRLGERLLQTVAPRFEEIDAELAAVRELREKPAGTIRITVSDHAYKSVLWPNLAKLLR